MSVLLVRQQKVFGFDVPAGFAVLGLSPDKRAQLLQGGDALLLGGAGESLLLSDIPPAATWYNGEVNSVVTPHIAATGDLSAGTDLVPLFWRIVPQGVDDVAGAQQLMDGGPNILQLGLGDFDEKLVRDFTGTGTEVMTVAYAVCVSPTAVPGAYTGSAAMVAQGDTNIASWLAAMKKVEWSAGLGATFIRAMSTPAFGAGGLQTQLMLQAGAV